MSAAAPPRSSATTADVTTVGSNAPGITDQPVSSSSTASSKRPNPCPPNASGTWMPNHPWAASSFQTGWSVSSSASRRARGTEGGQWASSQRRAESRCASCSSVSAIGMGSPLVLDLLECAAVDAASPVVLVHEDEGEGPGGATLHRHPDPVLVVTRRGPPPPTIPSSPRSNVDGAQIEAVAGSYAPVAIDHNPNRHPTNLRSLLGAWPSWRLRTLPLGSRGSSSTTSQCRGHLVLGQAGADVPGQLVGRRPGAAAAPWPSDVPRHARRGPRRRRSRPRRGARTAPPRSRAGRC